MSEKKDTITRVVKLQLAVVGDADKKKADWEFLRDLSYKTYRAYNQVVSFLWADFTFKNHLKEAGYDNIKEGLKNIYGKGEQAFSRSMIKEEHNLPSGVADVVAQQASKYFKSDMKEVLRGDRSLRNYRRGVPIPFRVRNIKFSPTGFRWLPRSQNIEFIFVYGRDKSNLQITMQRILAGEYKACDSEIKIDRKKLFLFLTFQQPKGDFALNPDKVVGVDLGINFPAYVAVNEGLQRKPVGNKRELLKHRTQMQARRRRLQSQVKLAKGGKGRKHKLSALNQLRDAERKYVNTYNHTISKSVIDFALKQNAAKIRMEDLSSFKENRDSSGQYILRNWSYYELQQMIKYKAESYNIEVEFIDPRNTSKGCSACGHIDAQNRQTQAKFECTNCGTKMNADYNAAVNIARGGAAKIVSSTVKSSISTGDRRQTRAVPRPKSEGCGHSLILNGAKQAEIQF